MICTVAKWGAVSVAVVGIGAGLLFGTDALSYAKTSRNQVSNAVKDAVPLEFELARARDMVDRIVPEMQANIKLIATEEVQIMQLNHEIERSGNALTEEKIKLATLRDMLRGPQVQFTIANQTYGRTEVAEELSNRFGNIQEAAVVLEGKEKLLETRQRNLQTAIRTLDKTRSQKSMLEQRIAALEGQYRLVQAAGVGSDFHLDDTQLAKAEKLIGHIKQRLDVAERVLAHESKFVGAIPIESMVDEPDLLANVDDFLDQDRTDAMDEGLIDAGRQLAPESQASGRDNSGDVLNDLLSRR